MVQSKSKVIPGLHHFLFVAGQGNSLAQGARITGSVGVSTFKVKVGKTVHRIPRDVSTPLETKTPTGAPSKPQETDKAMPLSVVLAPTSISVASGLVVESGRTHTMGDDEASLVSVETGDPHVSEDIAPQHDTDVQYQPLPPCLDCNQGRPQVLFTHCQHFYACKKCFEKLAKTLPGYYNPKTHEAKCFGCDVVSTISLCM
jgi:hypothetical protein